MVAIPNNQKKLKQRNGEESRSNHLSSVVRLCVLLNVSLNLEVSFISIVGNL